MGLCGCFTSSRSRNADPESKQTADDEDYAGQLARLMSCQLEGEPVVTVRQLSNARVNVSAVESSEPQKEFMPHTARLRSMDFSAHAQGSPCWWGAAVHSICPLSTHDHVLPLHVATPQRFVSRWTGLPAGGTWTVPSSQSRRRRASGRCGRLACSWRRTRCGRG